MDRVASNKQRTIWAAFVLSLIQWTSFAVEISLLAFIGKDSGVDDVHFGYLNTVGAFCQLISSPFYSHLAGTNLRKAITLAFFSASVSYLLTALANGFWLLLLSRLVSVFAGHAAVACQTAVASSTTPEQRTAYFGKLGASTGAGFILGSILGGILAGKVGLRAPLYLASAACGIAAIVGPIFINVDQTTTDKKSDEPNESKGIKGYLRLLSSKRVATILACKNFVFGPFMLAMSVIGVYMINEFKIKPGQNSYMLLFMGVINMAMNAVGIGLLKKYLTDRMLLLGGVIAFGLYGFGLVASRSLFHFFLFMPFQSIGLCLVASSTDGMLTKSVQASDHALVVSLGWALDAFTRVVGPVLAGIILSKFGFGAFGFGIVAGSICAAVLAQIVLEEEEKEKKDE